MKQEKTKTRKYENEKKWQQVRNKNTKKWKTLSILLKIKQKIFKHEVKKFNFLKYKKFFSNSPSYFLKRKKKS